MRDTTLLFLIRKEEGDNVSDICLAMKKRGFGVGRYNGTGGKVEAGESIEDAVRREAKEEIGIDVGGLVKRGELTFTFPHKPEWNQLVHVYLAEEWDGDVAETEEMKPEWFNVEKIPYENMWPDDIFWLPHTLQGKFVRARFEFMEGDIISSQEVSVE